MKHIDTNTLKHLGITFGLSLIGGIYGACAAAGASVTKEWCDKQSYGHWCWVDLAADTIGTVLGLVANKLIMNWIS